MLTGLTAGITWALETVVLGVALSSSPFVSTSTAIILAPFISTFLHYTFSAILTWIINAIRGKTKEVFSLFKNSDFKWLIIASIIGGPIGMTGYVLTVNNLGPSIGAVASAIYPAIGSILAFLFLKEKLKWYQWLFLFGTLIGVYGLSYSPSIEISNFLIGFLGALMCSFGWGIEGVILSKCLKSKEIKSEYALQIRQTVSSIVYGIIILPILNGWGFTLSLFTIKNSTTLLTIALAGIFATISYLFYYKTISKLGTAKAMGLNITYTAWAVAISLILLKDTSILNLPSILCALLIVVCGIFTAIDVVELFKNKN